MKRLLVAALVVLVPAMASANPWYLYDGPTGHHVCESTAILAHSQYESKAILSPWSFSKLASSHHDHHRTKVVRHDGKIISVTIPWGAAKFMFWRSQPACENYAAVRARRWEAAERVPMACDNSKGHERMREAIRSLDKNSAGPWMHYVHTLPNFYPSQWPNSLTCLVVVRYGGGPGGPEPIKEVHPVTIRKLSHGRGWVASIP